MDKDLEDTKIQLREIGEAVNRILSQVSDYEGTLQRIAQADDDDTAKGLATAAKVTLRRWGKDA